MRLYIGSTQQFIKDTVHNQIADRLKAAFFNYYRYAPSPGEMRSWRQSLASISQVFQHNNLLDHGIILEYQIPFTSKRLDCLIAGRDSHGKDNAVIIELKQWEKCSPADGENEVITYVGGANREVLHPSAQVGQYATYLQDVHTAFYEPPKPVTLSACAYLHNYRFVSDEVLLTEKFAQNLERYPLFSMDDVDPLSGFLKTRLEGGAGLEVLGRIEDGRYRPSKKLMDHVGNVIKGKPEYILLDEQLVAYDRVMASARTGIGDRRKTVIIIKGGPGTGKSVIAINLMADLLLAGYNAHYATGSKAFTETLRKIIGNRGAVQFKYFNSYMDANPDAVDVLICDEAHRIRETSHNRFTAKAKRTDAPQIQELISASRVSVFFIDQDQIVRPAEIGSVRHIREFAAKNDCLLFEHELETQFRCSGSDAFVSWINNTLGIARTAHVLWTGEENFEFKIFDSPESLEATIRLKAREGFSARMTAGFCWEWSKHNPKAALNDDVVIGEYKRPWNARHEATKLPKGVPKAQFWAHDPNGIDQIGCVYTAQGFEFDYVGVIFGNDIMYSFLDGSWVGHPENSKDPVVRGAKGKFIDLAKNTYRVLLSRGLKGCYVYFLDPDTEKFFRSRMDITGEAHHKVREEEIEPYVNALPLFDLRDLEGMSLAEWRARLEECWKGEYRHVLGGPFLRNRFLVRAEDASMEPLIPKDAFCQFRIPSVESPDNQVVLAGISTYSKKTSGVTIKRYQRLSIIQAGQVAETTKILLTSENKTFPALELRAGVDNIEI
ncbi:MAG TPA: DUF2075 domain-containing protein, partial [Candidatus Eisenbacteria bacterium]|nr:DUF2075 domain-containing protein [Candidatus Eisenbacteria bacterium]